MRALAGAALVAVATAAFPAPVVAATVPLELPAARVGDAWTVDVLGDRYGLEIVGVARVPDRWGRVVDAASVSVEGFHPVAFESKDLVDHRFYLDLSSGVQIADIAAYRFAGTDATSLPAAYSTFEQNNPDGWPGWVQAGGLLAGRTLVPGGSITVPFVMTNTTGADRLTLAIEEAPPSGGRRCVLGSGTATFPSYTYWSDGYRRTTLAVSIELTHCEGVPYAERIRVGYAAAWSHAVEFTRSSFTAGEGAEIGTDPYHVPERHVASRPVAFDGALRDGGPLTVPSLEEAQQAATLAPGLLAWRAVHPDAYLVEAELLTAELGGVGSGRDRWRLTYAAPSGHRHSVLVVFAAVPVAIDQPQVDAYPAPVPPLAAWPPRVVSVAGAIDVWRSVAGAAATPTGLRWQPLLDDHWYVMGKVPIVVGGEPSGTLYVELPLDHATGALGTGEHPVPSLPLP